MFVYLGYIAKRMNVDISEVAQEGYGLVFQIYPEALCTLPMAKVWSLLFFVMLITLGLDSAVRCKPIHVSELEPSVIVQMGGLESVITGIMDEWKIKSISREVFTGMVLITSFGVSLINCSEVRILRHKIRWLSILIVFRVEDTL